MKREDILAKAKECVTNDRQATYGTPENSFTRIANLWTSFLSAYKLASGVALSAADVSVMLGMLKIARIASSPQHADNWVDLAGYAACGGEIATEETKK